MDILLFSTPEEVQEGSVCWQDGFHFFYSEGVIVIDYLEKEKTINGHTPELEQPKDAIKSECRENLTAGVLLLHDNAPVHTVQVAVVEAAYCGF